MSKLSTNEAKAVQRRYKCPKRGKFFITCPALSRKDNKTDLLRVWLHGSIRSIFIARKTKILKCYGP